MECLASLLIIGLMYGVVSLLIRLNVIDPDSL
jgi:hypothetical protein